MTDKRGWMLEVISIQEVAREEVLVTPVVVKEVWAKSQTPHPSCQRQVKQEPYILISSAAAAAFAKENKRAKAAGLLSKAA